jgi:GNAT superfamily N-acetyltransferase
MPSSEIAASTEHAAGQVRRYVAADRNEVVETLIRAFFDDPVFAWVLPDPATRAAKMRWLGHRWLRARERQDDLFVVDKARGLLVGVAPTGNPNVPFWSQVKLGLLAMPFIFGVRSFRRFLAVDADLTRRHAEELTSPHYVIDILAVDPPSQGSGWGTRLLDGYLQRADEQRLPSYLVTNNPRNLPFYERAGFRVIREALVARDAVLGWSMRRPAG